MQHPYLLGKPRVGKFAPTDGVSVRIGRNLLKTVVFFGVPSTTKTDEMEYGGTGFLVSYRETVTHPYLVTARHVAERLIQHQDTGFVIRVNRVSGGFKEIPVSKIDWTFHPDPTVDIAISEYTLVNTEWDAGYYVWEDRGIILPDDDIWCGDPISIIGLFRLHYGSQRNMPFAHTGNVAMMPDKNEPIPVKNVITDKVDLVYGYLVEAQTLSGLSGSPVFAREPFALAVQDPIGGAMPIVYNGTAKFLGLYTGAWDGEPGEILAADRTPRGGVRVPVGVGVVVPAEKISELIKESQTLQDKRKQRIQDQLKDRAVSADSGFPIASNSAESSDENPRHKEDFTGLLNAAARKKPQGA
jgi:hypothetical protein